MLSQGNEKPKGITPLLHAGHPARGHRERSPVLTGTLQMREDHPCFWRKAKPSKGKQPSQSHTARKFTIETLSKPFCAVPQWRRLNH